jgi:predicted nucleotidyltransferase
MAELSAIERDCLERYCRVLADRLGPRLVDVRMFGSAARGDMWARARRCIRTSTCSS